MYNMPFFDNSLLLFLAFCASILLPSVTSIIRLVREKDLLSVMLVLLCGLLASTTLRVFFFLNEGEIINQIPKVTEWQKDVLSNHFDTLLISILIVVILANLALWLIVRYCSKENVWKWIIGAFVLLLSTMMAIAVVVNAIIGGPLEQCFFDVCCGFLWVCGAAW